MPTPQRISLPTLALWITALLLALFLASRGWDKVFIDGMAHPVGNDSFYHMARIAEIAEAPGSIHEFDNRLQWPEGMWITWPWGYDYLAGVVVGALSSDSAEAAHVAMFIPLALLLINLGLIGLIARTVLTPALSAVCVLAYAAAPLTLTLHYLGKIDHHAAEHTLWLLTIVMALGWQSSPHSASRAAALGAVLGVASAFHNGLFLLQLPVLALLAYNRLFGRGGPGGRPGAAFCAALMASQLLVLLPSHHFHALAYEFYYLSWFHLHVAALTCLGVFALGRKNAKLTWALLGLSVVLALPAARQAIYGLGFMGAQLTGLEGIVETNSPFWGELSVRRISNSYSGLIWTVPLLAAWCVYRLATRRAQAVEAALLVMGLFGMLLMSLQVRFSQFGSPFLVLIPLLILQAHFPRQRPVLYATILFLGAYLQAISTYAFRYPIGGSERYERGLALIQALDDACAEQPGLILANQNWGNFLRYRTQCPLLVNNFIMTADDIEAIKNSRHYLSLQPEQLLVELPEVKYVLASSLERNDLSEALLDGPARAEFEVLAETHDFRGEATGRAYRIKGGD